MMMPSYPDATPVHHAVCKRCGELVIDCTCYFDFMDKLDRIAQIRQKRSKYKVFKAKYETLLKEYGFGKYVE